MRIIVRDVQCPRCGAGEMHPDGERLLIRGFKVQTEDGHWWSECLVCAGYYNADLTERPRQPGQRYPDGYDKERGWF